MIDKKIRVDTDCMGCHACCNICPIECISMEADDEGFCYPHVDYSMCIECSFCVEVCPIINRIISSSEPLAFACINKDKDIRQDSSSGGVFSIVAEKILEKGGIVFGAAFNDSFDVIHCGIKLVEDLKYLRGSKYVQSSIGTSYKEVKAFLDVGREVLFTGTPCQVEGLLHYLDKEYDNLFTMDIICHGVPSPKVWQAYVQYQQDVAESKAVKISFRDKVEGWKMFSMSLEFETGSVIRANKVKDLYLQVFLKDICLRPSCYECYFKGLNRRSDITMADFWGIRNVLPELDDDMGTSLILINTDKGQNMMDKVEDSMIRKKVDLNQAVQYNSAAFKSVAKNPNRENFLQEVDTVRFDQLVIKYYPVLGGGIRKFYAQTKVMAKRLSKALLRRISKVVRKT